MLRMCLTPLIAKYIQTPEVLIGHSSRAFNDAGDLNDEKSNELLEKLLEKFLAQSQYNASECQ